MSSAQTPTSSTPQIPIDERTFDACKQAFDEVRAARPLIEANSSLINSLKENSQLKDEKLELQKSILDLKTQQLAEKDKVIVNEREAKAKTELQLEEVHKRNAQLEKKLQRSRKFSLGAGGVLAILISVLVLR